MRLGQWLEEKHGARTRRAWRKLHVGVDADTGQILAALTTSDVVDASQAGPPLDQVTVPVTSFTATGAYDQDGVYAAVAARHPEAAVVVPPRSSAMPSDTADTTPRQRDRHIRNIAEHGRKAWPVTSGYRWRALVKADISRLKRVIGGSLHSRTDQRRTTEVDMALLH